MEGEGRTLSSEQMADYLAELCDAYPIASFTWLLVRKDTKDQAKAKLMKDFLTWMVTPEAQAMASDLHYSPLPAEVVSLVQARLETLKAGGKAIAAN